MTAWRSAVRFLMVALVLGTTMISLAEAETVEVTADGNIQSEAATGSSVGGDASKSKEDSSNKSTIDPNCPDRDHLMRCAKVHLDLNKNNKLDRDELEGAIAKLPW